MRVSKSILMKVTATVLVMIFSFHTVLGANTGIYTGSVPVESLKTLQVQTPYKPIAGLTMYYQNLIKANLKYFLKNTPTDLENLSYRINMLLETKHGKEFASQNNLRILYDYSSPLKRKERGNWILPCSIVGPKEEIISGPYEAVISPKGNIDIQVPASEKNEKQPPKAFGQVGGEMPEYEARPDDIQLEDGAMVMDKKSKNIGFIFEEQPVVTDLFKETMDALLLMVSFDDVLKAHFKDILQKESSKSIKIGFDDKHVSINSWRQGDAIMFNENFMRSLIKMFTSGTEQHKNWAKYILMHRLLHELGHSPDWTHLQQEINEEKKLINIDLILYYLLKELTELQKKTIDPIFKDEKLKDEIRFSSGYYFRFLDALLSLDVETKDIVIEYYAAHPNITKDEINELILRLKPDSDESLQGDVRKEIIKEYINSAEAKDIAKSHFQVAAPMTSSVLQGARTGEVSVQDINDAGADYVVIDKPGPGESAQTMRERMRMVFEKTNKTVAAKLDITNFTYDNHATWTLALRGYFNWIKSSQLDRLVLILGSDLRGENLSVSLKKTNEVAGMIRTELLKIAANNDKLTQEEAAAKMKKMRIIYEMNENSAGVLSNNLIGKDEKLPEHLNGVFLMPRIFNNAEVIRKMINRIYTQWKQRGETSVKPLILCDCRNVFDSELFHENLYGLSAELRYNKPKHLMGDLTEYVDFAVVAPFLNLRKTAWETGKFVYTPRTKAWEGASVKLALQDLESLDETYFQELKSKKVTHVILGHSERRKYHAESSENLIKKIKAVVAHGMVPIFCIGEKESEINQWKKVLSKQLKDVLSGLARNEITSLIIAHEPVYAIEGSTPATPRQIETTAKFIRNTVLKRYIKDQKTRNSIRIIYGGSVKGSNVYEIMGSEARIAPAVLRVLKGMWDVIGALVGGRSLTPDFCKIFQRAADVCRRLGKPAPVIIANWKMGKTNMQDAEDSIKTFCKKAKSIRHDVEVIVACNATQVENVSNMLFSVNQPVSPDAPKITAREQFLNDIVTDFTRWMWRNGFETTPEFIDKALKKLYKLYFNSELTVELKKYGISWYTLLKQAVLSPVFVEGDVIKAAEELYGGNGYDEWWDFKEEIPESIEKYRLNEYELTILSWIRPSSLMDKGLICESMIMDIKATPGERILNLWRYADEVLDLPFESMKSGEYDKKKAKAFLKRFEEGLGVGDQIIGDNLKRVLTYLDWQTEIDVRITSDRLWPVTDKVKALSRSSALQDKMLADLYFLIRKIDSYRIKKGDQQYLFFQLAESIIDSDNMDYVDIDNIFMFDINSEYLEDMEDVILDKAIDRAQIEYENLLRVNVLSKEREELKKQIDTFKDIKAEGGITAYLKYKLRDIIAVRKAEKLKKYDIETRVDPLDMKVGIPVNAQKPHPRQEVVNPIHTNLYLPGFSMDAADTIHKRLVAELIRRWVNDPNNINVRHSNIFGVKKGDIPRFARFLQNNIFTGRANFEVTHFDKQDTHLVINYEDKSLVLNFRSNLGEYKSAGTGDQLVVVCDRTKYDEKTLSEQLKEYPGSILIVDPANDPDDEIFVSGVKDDIKDSGKVYHYASAFTDAASHLFKAFGEKFGVKNYSVTYCRPSMLGELISSSKNVGKGLIKLLPNLGLTKEALKSKEEFSGQMYDIQVNRGGAVAQINLDLGQEVTKGQVKGFLRNLAFNPLMRDRVVISEDINLFHSANVAGKDPVLFIDAGSVSVRDGSTFVGMRAWIPEEWSLAHSITDLIKKIGVERERSPKGDFPEPDIHKNAIKHSHVRTSHILRKFVLSKAQDLKGVKSELEIIREDNIDVPVVTLTADKSSDIRSLKDMLESVTGSKIITFSNQNFRSHVYKAGDYVFSSPHYSEFYMQGGNEKIVRKSAISEFVQAKKMQQQGYPVVRVFGVILIQTHDANEYFLMEEYGDDFEDVCKIMKDKYEIMASVTKEEDADIEEKITIIKDYILNRARKLGEFFRFLRAASPTLSQIQINVLKSGEIIVLTDIPRYHIDPEMDISEQNRKRIEDLIAYTFEQLKKNTPEELLGEMEKEFNKGLRTERVVIQGGESPVMQAFYGQSIGKTGIDPRAVNIVRYDKILHYQNEEFIRLLRDMYPGAVVEGGDTWISINGKRIQVLNSSDNKPINAETYGAGTVICDVAWSPKTREEALKYIEQGAERVIFVGGSEDAGMKTFIPGVMEKPGAEDHIIATGTAENNAVATVMSILQKGVKVGDERSVFVSERISPLHTVHDGSGSGAYKYSRAPIANIAALPEERGEGLDSDLQSLLGTSSGVGAETGAQKGSIAFVTVRLEENVGVKEIKELFELASYRGDIEVNRFAGRLGTDDVVGKDKLVFDLNSIHIVDNLLTIAVGFDNDTFLAGQVRRLIEEADSCGKPEKGYIEKIKQETASEKLKDKSKKEDSKADRPVDKDKKSEYIPLPSPDKTAPKFRPQGMKVPAQIKMDLSEFSFDKGRRSAINQLAAELLWKWTGNEAIAVCSICLPDEPLLENGRDVSLREFVRYLKKEFKDGPIYADVDFVQNIQDKEGFTELGYLHINDPNKHNPILITRGKDMRTNAHVGTPGIFNLDQWIKITTDAQVNEEEYKPLFCKVHVINPLKDIYGLKGNVQGAQKFENVFYYPSVTSSAAGRAIEAMIGYDANFSNINAISASPERAGEVKIKDEKTEEVGYRNSAGWFIPYNVTTLETPVRKQGNLVKLTFDLSQKATVKEINDHFKKVSNEKGIKYLEKGMGWTSIDMKNCEAPCAFESELTETDGYLATVYVWASESTLAGTITDTIISTSLEDQKEIKDLGDVSKTATIAPNSVQFKEKEIIPELKNKAAGVVVAGAFGRTGKGFLRTILGDKNIDLKAIVLTSVKNIKKYIIGLRNDSAYGQFGVEVEYGGIDPENGWHYIWIGNDANGWKKVYAFAEKKLGKVPFKKLGAEVYLHATGRGLHRLKERAALEAGVTTIFASAPYKGEAVKSVWGVNRDNEQEELEDDIVSPASCTTGALAGACKVLVDYLGDCFDELVGLTIHEATNDQTVTRVIHRTAVRGEAAYDTTVGTSSGAGTAVGLAVSELLGKAAIAAARTGFGGASIAEPVMRLKPNFERFGPTGFPTVEGLNEVLRKASKGQLKGILGFHEGDWELTSEEAKSKLESGVIEPRLMRLEGNLLRFGSWYDNELAFSRRLADQIPYIAAKRRDINPESQSKSKKQDTPKAKNKSENQKKPQKKKAPGILDRNLKDTKDLATSLKETMVSICSSYSFSNRLVLIFDNTIGQKHEGDVLDIVDALEDLKKDPKVGPILKNLITIKAAPGNISSKVSEYIGADQTEVFLFANADSRPVLKNIEKDVNSVYIKEDGFNPRAYHPLTDIIAISLAENLAKRLNGSILNKVREIMKDLNIEQIEPGPDGILIFYLLPNAKPYNKGELLKEIGAIKRTLKSV
ncbi:MAG: triose-phosphate isomerase [Candidatus Omnitrophota bacterium]